MAKESEFELSDLEGPSVDRRTTLKLLGPLGSVAAASAIAGCTGGSDGSDGSSDGSDGSPTAASDKYGGTLNTIWAHDQIQNLDPHYMNDPDQFMIQSNIMNAITKITEEGEIVGDLAKDWTIPDATTYVFNLHENVTWHNGDNFTAEDVKWSMERLQGLDDSPHRAKLSSLDSVEVTNDYEVTVHLTDPTAPFLAFMTRGPGRAGVIVHRSAGTDTLSSGSQAQKEYNRMPIGTGPFKIDDRDPGSSASFSRFEDYFETDEDGNQLPYLDGFEIRFLTEASTMFTALNTGNAQLINTVPGSILQKVNNVDGLKTTSAKPGAFKTVDFVSVNPHEYPKRASYTGGYPEEEVTDKWTDQDLVTTDPRVRKAITMAIDREALVEKAWFGIAAPARQFYNPLMGWVHEEEPPKERGQFYNPEKAKQLLDEAGYTGDPRMEITFLGPTGSKRPMTVIQQQLSNVGIEAEIVLKSPNAATNESYRYIHPLYRYDGGSDIDPYMSHWNQRGSPDPTREYVQEWGFGNWSKGLWCNEAFDKKIIEDFQTPKFEDRREVLHEAQAIHESLEEGPRDGDQGGPSCAMTVFPLAVKAFSEEVKGVTFPAALNDFHRAYLTE